MALYNTIYHVAIGGKTLVFEGNEELSVFRWRKGAPYSKCLERFVTIISRIGIVRAKFEDGVFRKMMVFENTGDGSCASLAFMLYLCIALNYTDSNIQKGFLSRLTQYIDDRPEVYMPLLHAAGHSWSRVSECANKKEGLHLFHHHAFANMIGVPVRTFTSGPHLAADPLQNLNFRGEWEQLSGHAISQVRVPIAFSHIDLPPSYNMHYIEDYKACNVWQMNFGTWGHLVLMAHILYQRPKLPDEFDDEEDRNEALVHLAKRNLTEITGSLSPTFLKMRQIILDAYFAERPLDASGYWNGDGRWVANIGRKGPNPKRALELLGDSVPDIRVPWETAGDLRRPLFYTRIVDEMSRHQIDLNIAEVD